MQLLTGNDNVDHWTDQRTWDAVLANVRIVVSTHKVLLDACDHGFVQMSQVALLIYDEGEIPRCYANTQVDIFQRIVRFETALIEQHRANILDCVGGHPANDLQRNHYFPRLREDAYVPKILGLTASPVMKAKVNNEALK